MSGSWHPTARRLGLLLLSWIILPAAGAHAGTLTLRWVDTSSNEAGFEVQRKAAPAGAYTGITTVAADVTTYVDTELITGGSYCYRVRAFNAAGSSAYSNEACNTALPDEPGPPLPGFPVVTLLSAGATEVTYSVAWSPGTDQSAVPAASYRYAAGYNDGSVTRAGAVATTALTLTMAYHASGRGGGAYICVRAVSEAGASSGAKCSRFTVPARGGSAPLPKPGWPVVRLLSTDAAGAKYEVTWSPAIDQQSGSAPSYSYAAGYNDGSAARSGAVATTALTLTMAYHAGGQAGNAYICVRASQAGALSGASCSGFTVPARSRSAPVPMPGWPVVRLLSTDAAGATYDVTWSPSTDQPSGSPVPSYSYAAGYHDGSAARNGAVATPALTLTMAYHASGRAGNAYICVRAVSLTGAPGEPRCSGFTVPARGDSPPPPMPGRPIVTLTSSDAAGVRYGVTWSPATEQPAGAPVPSYSYVAEYSDGSATRTGTVATSALRLTMAYHASGRAGEAYICVRAVNQAGAHSEPRCSGFRVPDRAGVAVAGPASVTLTFVKAGLGSGTVTSTPAGIACNATCASGFPPGTRLTLTANPGPGSVFAGWTAGPCSGDRVCTLTLASATTVMATFDRQPSERPMQVVAVAGAGSVARVRGFTATGVPTTTDFLAYGPEFTDGVSLAVGSLPGLADPVIVTGTGPGGAAEVRAFRPDNSGAGLRFQPHGPDFSGGVRVAICDLKGDGRMEILTAPGPGGLPTVTVWSVNGAAVSKRLEVPVAPARFGGGVFVACADVNGDGAAEIVAGLDAGGAPEVAVFTAKDGRAAELTRFLAHEAPFTGGVRVAAADLDGDGRAEIVTGLGPGGEPVVTIFSMGPSGASPVARFHGYDASFTGGVFVAGGAREDGRARLFVSPGPGAEPVLRVFAVVGAMIAELGEFPVSGTPSLDGATIGAAP